MVFQLNRTNKSTKNKFKLASDEQTKLVSDRLSSSIEERNTIPLRSYQGYLGRFGTDTINNLKDVFKQSEKLVTSPESPFAGTAISSSYKSNPSLFEQTYGKLGTLGEQLTSLFGVGTNIVASPLNSVFSAMDNGRWEPGKVAKTLGKIGEGFDYITKGTEKVFSDIGYSPISAEVSGQGLVNLATGMGGEMAVSRAFSKLKVYNELKKANISETLNTEKEAITNQVNKDIEDTHKDNFIAQNDYLKQAQGIVDKFHSKVEDGTLTKADTNQTKEVLNSLGVKNTEYFTKRFQEQNSTSKIKNDFEIEKINELDNTITNNKKLEDYYNPSKITDNEIKIKIDNIKKLESLGMFKVSTPEGLSSFISPIPKITTKIRKVFGNDTKAINEAIEYRREIFKDTPQEKLVTLFADNSIKKEIGNLGKDTVEIPIKRKLISELVDDGILKEEISSDKLYSYKLTPKGAEISKGLGFSEKQIKFGQEKGLYHHNIEDMDNFRASTLEVPTITTDTDFATMNKLVNQIPEGNVAFLGLKKILNRLNNNHNLGLSNDILIAKDLKDLTKISDNINKIADIGFNKRIKPVELEGITPINDTIKNFDKSSKIEGEFNKLTNDNIDEISSNIADIIGKQSKVQIIKEAIIKFMKELGEKFMDNLYKIVEYIAEKTGAKIKFIQESKFGDFKKVELEYRIAKSKIEDIFKKSVKDITINNKGNIPLINQLLKIANERRISEIMELNLKHRKYGELKTNRINEYRLAYRNGKILGDINKIITQITQGNIKTIVDGKEIFKKNTAWNEAKTPIEIDKQFRRLDEAISKEHIRGLKKEIVKELSSVIKITKSTDKAIRLGKTAEIEGLLYEMKQKFLANQKDYINIKELNDLLNDIKNLKANSIKIAKQKQIDIWKTIDSDIKQIEEDGITVLTGKDELNIRSSTMDRIYANGNWLSASFTHKHQLFQKVFGLVSKGYKLAHDRFIGEPERALNLVREFYETKVDTTIQGIYKNFMEKGKLNKEALADYGIYQLSLQIDGEKLIGLDALMNAPDMEDFMIKNLDEFNNLKQPNWINDTIWDEIKNTKLGSIISKGEDDIRFQGARKTLQDFNKILFDGDGKNIKGYKQIVEEFDGIELKGRGLDYLPMKTTDFINSIKFGEVNFFRPAMGNSASHVVLETRQGLGLNYNTDIFNLISYGNKQTILQIFAREAFEKMSQTYYGKQMSFKKLSDQQIFDLLSKKDKDGNSIYKVTDRSGNSLDEQFKDIEDIEDIHRYTVNNENNLDNIVVTNVGGGIRKNMNKTTDKYFVNQIERFALGGSVKTSDIDNLMIGLTNQIAANAIGLNISTVAMQTLSLGDAAIYLGTRNIASTMNELTHDVSLMKRAYEASETIKSRLGGIPIYQDILSVTNDPTLVGGFKRLLQKYNNIILKPMQWTDANVFGIIWVTAYKDALKKSGKTWTGNFDDLIAVKSANIISQEIAGSSSKINRPSAFDNVAAKMFLTLGTQQLARVDKMLMEVKQAIKDERYYDGLRYTAMFTAINSIALIIPVYIGTILYDMGASETNPADYGTWKDRVFSGEGYWQMTLGQSILGGKALSLVNYGSLSVTEGAVNNMYKGIKTIKQGMSDEDFNKEVEGYMKVITSIIGNKPYSMLKAGYNNYIAE